MENWTLSTLGSETLSSADALLTSLTSAMSGIGLCLFCLSHFTKRVLFFWKCSNLLSDHRLCKTERYILFLEDRNSRWKMTRFGKMSIFLELFLLEKGILDLWFPVFLVWWYTFKFTWYGDYLKPSTCQSIKPQKPETHNNPFLGLGLTGCEIQF